MNQETRSRDILNTLKDVAEGHYTPEEGRDLILGDLGHYTPQLPAPEPAKPFAGSQNPTLDMQNWKQVRPAAPEQPASELCLKQASMYDGERLCFMPKNHEGKCRFYAKEDAPEQPVSATPQSYRAWLKQKVADDPAYLNVSLESERAEAHAASLRHEIAALKEELRRARLCRWCAAQLPRDNDDYHLEQTPTGGYRRYLCVGRSRIAELEAKK